MPGGVGSTRIVAHPIGVDAEEFERRADDPAVLERQAEIEAWRPEHLVVRVDRVDPSKNIVRGFEAFGLLLERHPELHGKVAFLALLSPSREDIAEYAEYTAEIEAAAAAVNERFARDDWTPVELDIADDFPRSLAGYKEFDVLLVNAVYDGLNLVAKEAFLLNTRDGALVLSQNAGAHEELGQWAVSVDPFDVSGQADALYAALTLPPDERRRRAEAIRAHVRAHDIREWIDAQLKTSTPYDPLDERALPRGRVGRCAHGRRRRQGPLAPPRGCARRGAHGAETARILRELPKGDALATAQLAGIMAAKRTCELIPLCHPLPLSHVEVELTVGDESVEIVASAETTAQTGVEMEALTAASVAALTVYDMAKAVDKGMRIVEVSLLEKTKEPVS